MLQNVTECYRMLQTSWLCHRELSGAGSAGAILGGAAILARLRAIFIEMALGDAWFERSGRRSEAEAEAKLSKNSSLFRETSKVSKNSGRVSKNSGRVTRIQVELLEFKSDIRALF